MGGFGLEGVYGRIPCPHCGSTDCMGIAGTHPDNELICSYKDKVVTEKQLERQAKKHKMTRYDIVEAGNGWQLNVFTFVSEDFQSWFQPGQVELYNERYGTRGTCPDLETAKKFAEANKNNLAAYYKGEII